MSDKPMSGNPQSDFSTLPMDQQESILLELANQSLSAWGLQGQLRLIKQRENAVYALTTDSGEKYALRVHRANYHSDQALQSELDWMEALAEYGIGVPQVIPTIYGAGFTVESVAGIDAARQVDLLAWIDGEQIGSVDEGLGGDPKAVHHIYFTIGEIAAKVHNQATSWQLPEGFQRHAWDAQGLVGDEPLWGQFWALAALRDEQRELLLTAKQALVEDLTKLSQSAETYSLIHADFVPENIMIDNRQVQVIDFDDAGFGWHLFELATALYFIQDDELYPVAKAALIEGYRKQRQLSDRQLAQLPMFLAVRSLTYLGWVHTRQGTETALEMTSTLIEMSCDAVEKYLQLR